MTRVMISMDDLEVIVDGGDDEGMGNREEETLP
jgi:hypothetical protein